MCVHKKGTEKAEDIGKENEDKEENDDDDEIEEMKL